MKSSIKKLLAIEILMIIIILLNFFISNILSNYKNLIFLILILVILLFIFGIDLKKSVRQKQVLINMLIYIFSYFIIIYLFGLFIGFNKTIYNFNITNLTKNILPSILSIILLELIRYELIKKSNNNILITILSLVVFTLLEISININLYNFNILDDIYEFIGICILSSLSKNIFLTILCTNTDYINNIVYRLIMELYIYVVPIVPALGPYMSSVSLILLPILLSLMVINTIKKGALNKPKQNRYNKIISVFVTVIMLIIVLLNSGYAKYQTLTIGSNSMKNYLSKGDVIVVDKLSNKEKSHIKKGEILVFKYNKKIISHRVYQVIKKDSKVYYKTKGDNNNQVDNNIVEIKDIIGISKYRIKYIGMPSVWLQEMLK